MKKMVLIMSMVIVTLVFVDEAQAHWPEQDKLLASDGAVNDNSGSSVCISGDYAIVGSAEDDDNGSRSGSAYIFKKSDTPGDPNWYQQCKLLASDGVANDNFGGEVSISGDYAIVGAYQYYSGGTGKAYIFKKSDTPGDPNWYQQCKLLASDAAADDGFGARVSISGDHAIVGASRNDDNGSNSGSAYIFKKSDTPGDPNWYQQDKLLASDAAAGDGFGMVSISGDYAIVGAWRNDGNGISNSGAAYVFAPNDVDPNNWEQIAKLTASDAAVGDNLGHGVSVNGDYAIVGAIFYDRATERESGAAYVFKRDGTSWIEQQRLDGSDSRDGFGHTVSISGDYAIVGASYDNGFTGSAYIFQRDGQSWIERKKLIASDAASSDSFGHGVSISGDYVIVGAYRDDDNGTDSGSAYIFNKVCPVGDLDNNCWVDFRDFAIMAGEWLQCN